MAVAVPVSLSALLPLLLTTTAIAISSVSWIEKVEGETVVLGCTWKGDPTGTEVLDVEWFLRMPTKTIYVATFVGGTEHVYAEFASRARFARNVTQRDASLQIAGLRASDLGVYTCKVKFGSFIKLETTKLTVLVKPSPPSCVVDGSVQQGQELSLRCLSTEGTAHIRYKWSKAGVERPLQPVLRGTLRIRNVSVSHSGVYQCNASNDVGWGSCAVTLSVVTPSAYAGVVTGTVMGVLLVAAAAVIGLLLKRKSVRNRDYHNDILIDDCPPRRSMSRPPTLATPRDLPSTRTSVGTATTSKGLPALRSAPGGAPPRGRAEGRARAGAVCGVREESGVRERRSRDDAGVMAPCRPRSTSMDHGEMPIGPPDAPPPDALVPPAEPAIPYDGPAKHTRTNSRRLL